MKPYTETEKRILKTLSDGHRHTRDEIAACLPELPNNYKLINTHISNIRRRLRLRGEEIVCELNNRRICYRHVRLLPSGRLG